VATAADPRSTWKTWRRSWRPGRFRPRSSEDLTAELWLWPARCFETCSETPAPISTRGLGHPGDSFRTVSKQVSGQLGSSELTAARWPSSRQEAPGALSGRDQPWRVTPGPRLLGKPGIRSAIDEALEAGAQRIRVMAGQAVARLAGVARDCARCAMRSIEDEAGQEAHLRDRGGAASILPFTALRLGCSLQDAAELMRSRLARRRP
jgi:hypothetical protein